MRDWIIFANYWIDDPLLSRRVVGDWNLSRDTIVVLDLVFIPCYFELKFLVANFFFDGLEYPQGIAKIAVSWCWIEAVLVLDPFNNQLKLSNCSA